MSAVKFSTHLGVCAYLNLNEFPGYARCPKVEDEFRTIECENLNLIVSLVLKIECLNFSVFIVGNEQHVIDVEL